MHTPCNFTTTERILKQSLNVFPFWTIHFWGTDNRWYLSLNLQCLLLLHQVTWILEILSCTQPTGRGHYCRSSTILRVWCKLIHITFSIPLWKKCYALFIKNMRNLKSHLPYSSYWESADFRKDSVQTILLTFISQGLGSWQENAFTQYGLHEETLTKELLVDRIKRGRGPILRWLILTHTVKSQQEQLSPPIWLNEQETELLPTKSWEL